MVLSLLVHHPHMRPLVALPPEGLGAVKALTVVRALATRAESSYCSCAAVHGRMHKGHSPRSASTATMHARQNTCAHGVLALSATPASSSRQTEHSAACASSLGCFLRMWRARSPAWTAAWWCSLAAVAAAFAYNETRYYREVHDRASSSFTRPGTSARDAAYRRATWTHVVCVHGGAAALAFVFVLRGLDDPS